MQNFAKKVWRWLFRGYETVLTCVAGAAFAIAEFSRIRDDLSILAQMQLDSWIGTLFGVCSVSYFYKAWWYLQNSSDKEGQMRKGAIHATFGALLLLIAWGFGVKMPFTG